MKKIVIYSAMATVSNAAPLGVLMPLYGNAGYINKAAKQLKKQLEDYIAQQHIEMIVELNEPDSSPDEIAVQSDVTLVLLSPALVGEIEDATSAKIMALREPEFSDTNCDISRIIQYIE